VTDREWIREQVVIFSRAMLEEALREDRLLALLPKESMVDIEDIFRQRFPIDQIPDDAAKQLRRLGPEAIQEMLRVDIGPMVRRSIAELRPS
jgi:hypothetical protein